MNRFLHLKLRVSEGFSLLEVVVSIGLMTVGLVGVLALLPVGLADYRDSKRLSVESQMIDYISKACLMGSIAELQSSQYYFDREGVICDEKKFEYQVSLAFGDRHGLNNKRLKTVKMTIKSKGSKKEKIKQILLMERLT